jgi:hypothetical protein
LYYGLYISAFAELNGLWAALILAERVGAHHDKEKVIIFIKRQIIGRSCAAYAADSPVKVVDIRCVEKAKRADWP